MKKTGKIRNQIALLTVGLMTAATTQAALVAEWKFDDGSGTSATDSVGTNDGTVTGAAWVAGGILGGALEFNGAGSSVEIPGAALLTVSDQVSISMWVYGSDEQPAQDSCFTGYRGADATSNRVFNIHLPYDSDTVYWDAGWDTTRDRISKAALPEEYKGKWNHWVFTKDRTLGTMNIYVNGLPWHSGTGMMRDMTGVVSAYIGPDYHGLMDEVQLYDTTLSATEAEALFDSYPAQAVFASINASPLSGTAPLEVVFDGSESTVANGSIAAYNWDFGDGNTDSGIEVTHNYTTAGNYTATLTVVNTLSQSNSTTVAIRVIADVTTETIDLVADPDNSTPAAYNTSIENLLTDSFDYSPADPLSDTPALNYQAGFHGNEASEPVTLSFTLNSAYTTVVDNPVVVLDAWGRDSNKGRDDDFDVIFCNGDYSEVVATVLGAGVDDATDHGRATNNMMAVGTTFDRIRIVGHDSSFTLTEVRLAAIAGELEIPPVVARMSTSSITGAAPLTVTFDASASTADAGIDSYEWNFGDGNTASGVLATNIYTEDGSYTAELTVMDVNSNSAMTSVQITVDSWNLPANIVLTTSVDVESAPPTVSSNDLAQTYFLSSSATGLGDGSVSNLFNGSVGLVNDTASAATLSPDASVTVNFDISVNTAGYDISSISSVFGWNSGGGGRANQGYRVVVTYVDDTTAMLVGPEEWESAGSYWTTVNFAETNGLAMATGVKAVTFDKIYAANAGGVVVPREFDIFGTPSGAVEIGDLIVSGTSFSWASAGVTLYGVQRRERLNIGDWITISNNIPATVPTNTFEMLVDDAPTAFYRVIIQD